MESLVTAPPSTTHPSAHVDELPKINKRRESVANPNKCIVFLFEPKNQNYEDDNFKSYVAGLDFRSSNLFSTFEFTCRLSRAPFDLFTADAITDTFDCIYTAILSPEMVVKLRQHPDVQLIDKSMVTRICTGLNAPLH